MGNFRMYMFVFLLLLLARVESSQYNDYIYNTLHFKDKELLDNLKSYNFVNPKDITSLNSRGMVTNAYQQDEQVERSISIPYKGKTIILDLVPNRSLISPKYMERYFLPNGKAVLRKRTHDCFFHGRVRGQEDDSNLAISTCDGYHGYFRINDDTFFIQPLFMKNRKKITHVMYNSNEINSTPFQCGHNGTHKDYFKTSSNQHHKVRRSALTEVKYVELMLVNDFSQFEAYGSSITQTKLRAISITNVVDSIYRVHNIRIALVLVETWSSGDLIVVTTDSFATLANFRAYKKTVLDTNNATKNHDNAQFLSQTQYNNSLFGGATYLKAMCSSYSVGVDSDKNSNAAVTGAIMAHEIGHNFGLNHDDSCASGCPSTNSAGCIMNAVLSTTPPQIFSQCSISELETLLQEGNVGACLFNAPTKLVTDVACGNALVEAEEDCDCGTQQECESVNNTCCNYTTCKLYDGKNCSDGLCCSECQFVARGTECRAEVNSCDLPEYCNGTSELCPSDIRVKNGTSCDSDKGYCYNGRCDTHDNQCDSLWSGGAVKSDDLCYSVGNIRGDFLGYCTKNAIGAFIACEAANVECGKLQCSGNNITLKLVFDSIRMETLTLSSGPICRTVRRVNGSDKTDLGIVEDGTKCGDGKMCKDHACKPLTEIFVGQPSCSNNCSGNGICNQNGNCHCLAGYKCPSCSESYTGPGGSLDSGLGCVIDTTDIDECTFFDSPCHSNATCNNTGGSFQCICNNGYSGNGTMCTDIDECSLVVSPCHSNATYSNIGGSFQCTCNNGFSGNGTSCKGMITIFVTFYCTD